MIGVTLSYQRLGVGLQQSRLGGCCCCCTCSLLLALTSSLPAGTVEASSATARPLCERCILYGHGPSPACWTSKPSARTVKCWSPVAVLPLLQLHHITLDLPPSTPSESNKTERQCSPVSTSTSPSSSLSRTPCRHPVPTIQPPAHVLMTSAVTRPPELRHQ